MRKLVEPKLVLATHNPGKVVEIQALLDPFGKQVVSAGELGLPEPVEDAPDFIGNAKIINESSGRWEKSRIRVKVGAAYGSDVKHVCEVQHWEEHCDSFSCLRERKIG